MVDGRPIEHENNDIVVERKDEDFGILKTTSDTPNCRTVNEDRKKSGAKSQRRVSFTGCTKTAESFDDYNDSLYEGEPTTRTFASTSGVVAAVDDAKIATPIKTPSPKKRRETSAATTTPQTAFSQERTPPHSNGIKPSASLKVCTSPVDTMEPPPSSIFRSPGGGANGVSYFEPLQMRPSSTVSLRKSHNAGPSSSRRSSLDSCSSFSSGVSSSCFSGASYNNFNIHSATASLASALSFRDEAFQRSKLLDCLEWLGRHMSQHVVHQLMEQVQLRHRQSIPSMTVTTKSSEVQIHPQFDAPSRTRLYPTTRRRLSLPNAASAPRRGSIGSSSWYRRKRSCAIARTPRRHSLDSTLNKGSFQQQEDRQQKGVLLPPVVIKSSFLSCGSGPFDDDDDDDQDGDEYDNHTSNDDNTNDCDSLLDDELDNISSSRQQHEVRRKKRLLKTQESIDRLSSNHGDAFADEDAMYMLGYESTNSESSWGGGEDVIGQEEALGRVELLPPPQTYRAALLMIDISGFTVLSVKLPLQALSKSINDYFQLIVECILEYGGDVVKFAGDAVFAEWKEQKINLEDESVDEEVKSKTVRVATACACRIVERCSDYKVYKNANVAAARVDGDKDDSNTLAVLNVHCGIGYGPLTLLHVGDDNRREYLLLGDPITQVSDGIVLGRGGEVVASPQAYKMLFGDLHEELDQRCFSGAQQETGNQPKVIFSSRQDRFETTPHLLELLPRPAGLVKNRCWTKTMVEWDIPSLLDLQQAMSRYVHPIVAEGELFTSIYHNRTAVSLSADSSSEGSASLTSRQTRQQQLQHDQQLLQSEAELRKVFTLFLQPLISLQLAEDQTSNEELMTILNEIMILTNRELSRFKGHLRQFIVDDKGVVLIANFGLRGSVLPHM